MQSANKLHRHSENDSRQLIKYLCPCYAPVAMAPFTTGCHRRQCGLAQVTSGRMPKEEKGFTPLITMCELTLHLSVQQMPLPRAIYSAYFLQCAYKSFYTGYSLKESGLSTLLKSAPQVPFLGTETNLVAKQVHRCYKYRTSARLPQIQLHNRD